MNVITCSSMPHTVTWLFDVPHHLRIDTGTPPYKERDVGIGIEGDVEEKHQ